jgi:EpsI family protein
VSQVRGRSIDDPVRATRHGRTFLVAALVACTIAALAPIAAQQIVRSTATTVPKLDAIGPAGGWIPTAAPITDWKPAFQGQAARLSQTFAKGGRLAGVEIDYYRAQQRGRELITSGNVLVTPGNAKWKEAAHAEMSTEWGGARHTVAHSSLDHGELRVEVLSAYWVDGQFTTSPYVGKMLQAWSRLRGRGDDAAFVALYVTATRDDHDAMRVLTDFANALGPGVERSLVAARGVHRLGEP